MKKIIIMLLIIPILIFAKGHDTVIENPFSIAFGGAGTNIYGDYVSIASSVECIKDSHEHCDDNYDGYLFDANTKYLNSVPTSLIPLNSSTETLSLPSDINGADIVYAGLFWQGHIAGTNADDYSSGIVGQYSVMMRDPSGTVHTLTANTNERWHHDCWGDGTGDGGGYRSFYQGYKDVTTILQSSYTKNQTNNYTVGNIKASVGLDHHQYLWTPDTELDNVKMGFYGNWNLIVVYRHPNVAMLSPRPKAKNITIFHGFDALIPLPTTNDDSSTKSINLNLSGFLTPASTPITAKLLFYGSGGEKKLAYDSLEIQDKNTTNYINLSNTANPIDDAFNGSISNLGVPVDSTISYYPGLDSDSFDVSSAMGTKQTTTKLRLTAKWIGNSGDQFFPGLIAFSTDLYEPEFCYDYAYKQQGKYFTEDNNGTQNPNIYGANIQTHEPIEVTMYVKNLVESDIAISNMEASVSDINTSYAHYINDSTKLAKTGDLTPNSIPDSNFIVGSNTNGDYIKDIPIGSIGSNENFYLYYSIDPSQTTIDMPIKMQVTYDLTTNGTTIPYTLTVGSNLKMCSTSNFEYEPTKGIFNIVHNDYYDYDINSNSSKRYYNLPTQVTDREGNFKVLEMDPDNLDNLSSDHNATVVAVEMIDAGAFHFTKASCSEMASAITKRVWVRLDENVTSVPFNKAAIQAAIDKGMTDLSTTHEFYKHATRNTAFRITYNSTDSNGSIVHLETIGDRTNVTNFSDLNQINCIADIDGIPNNTETASQYCSNAGTSYASAMTDAQLKKCMECVYGIDTRFICSRDNFAIRPEAFLMQIDDQNQTNSTQPQIDITTLSDSGSSSATNSVNLNLAAGYQYNIEVNATNHINNIASLGYTKTFNLSNLDEAKYFWNPLSTQIVTGCNSDANKTIEEDSGGSFRFLNGVIDRNTSFNNVGRYLLSIKDTTWTSVDSNSAYMGHHTSPYFTNTFDCYRTSDITLNTNATMTPTDESTLNGCNISSSHSNDEASLKYNDYNVTFHPYRFDLNATNGGFPITPSVGLSSTPVPATNPFIYIANINEPLDENMSYHLNGNINALGENNTTLINFVDKCYAVPLDINISTSNRDLNDSKGNHVDYRVRFHDINATGQVITALDINATDTNTSSHTADILLRTEQNATTGKGYFPKNLNGTMQTRLNMNYARTKNTTVNPKALTFIQYQVNCKNAAADCTFNADLVTNKTTKGVRDLNATLPIRHYYGRAHAGKQRYEDPNTGPIAHNANIYYGIYCFNAGCNPALLPSPKHVDDIRWYQNTAHITVNDGNVSGVTEKGAAGKVTSTNLLNGTNKTTVDLTYDGTLGYPYTTTMEINASNWLIYNEDDANATVNEFQVEFNKAGAGWVGKHETNAETNTTGAVKTNRRTMW